MNLPDLAARCRRLDALLIGLQRESAAVRSGADLLLYLERRAYLAALEATCRGLEDARVVLVKARWRIEGAGRR